MADVELSHAMKAALLALRDERPVPRFALPALEDLLIRGLLDREGLTDAGVKRADAERAALHGIGQIIRQPHKRDEKFERSRPWTR
jgi:hypothetical protein